MARVLLQAPNVKRAGGGRSVNLGAKDRCARSAAERARDEGFDDVAELIEVAPTPALVCDSNPAERRFLNAVPGFAESPALLVVAGTGRADVDGRYFAVVEEGEGVAYDGVCNVRFETSLIVPMAVSVVASGTAYRRTEAS